MEENNMCDCSRRHDLDGRLWLNIKGDDEPICRANVPIEQCKAHQDSTFQYYNNKPTSNVGLNYRFLGYIFSGVSVFAVILYFLK